MENIDYKLVAKGGSVPLAGLLDQARYHAELAKRFERQLGKKGWRPAHTSLILVTTADLETDRAAQLEARDESKANREREQAAITAAKEFKADLVMAFDDLFFDGVVTQQERQEANRTNGTLGRSAPAISRYLGDVRRLVEKYDDRLRPYFDGQSALGLLDKVKYELDEAQSKQETDYRKLPLDTLKLYEAKGRLLALIEKLNRIGKRAFAGQAEIVALFNKDLILRARKKRRSQSGVEPVEQVAEEKEEKAG